MPELAKIKACPNPQCLATDPKVVYDAPRKIWQVVCRVCGTTPEFSSETENGAIAVWNDRTAQIAAATAQSTRTLAEDNDAIIRVPDVFPFPTVETLESSIAVTEPNGTRTVVELADDEEVNPA